MTNSPTEKPDLLIARLEANTGKTAVYQASEPAILMKQVGRFVLWSISYLPPP
jgi:hypothetical protein